MSVCVTFNQHEGGFFSNFNKVITYLAHHDVSKIIWNLQGQSYGAFAYNCGEVFSKLFQEYNNNDNITHHYIVKDFLYLNYTGRNAHKLYTESDEWRTQLYDVYKKYILPTPELQKHIDTIDKSFSCIDKVKVGILKRNQLLKCEQVNNKMPELERYIETINSIEYDKVCILSVDNISDISKIKDIGVKSIYSQNIKRTYIDTDTEPHFVPGTSFDAMLFFIEVYMLSKCDYLIHPISNMATAALYFNPKLKSIYLQ